MELAFDKHSVLFKMTCLLIYLLNQFIEPLYIYRSF